MPQDDSSGGHRRARQRAETRQALIDAAQRLIAEEGPDRLTMQRVADELRCSVGAIYRYFHSKDELIAAVHGDQLDVLRRSQASGQARIDTTLAAMADPPATRALARAMATAWYWIDAARTFPRQLELARDLLARPVSAPAPAPSGPPVTVAVARRLADPLTLALDAAHRHGVLHDGDASWRATVTVATVTAATSTGIDHDRAGPGTTLARHLVACLLGVWGADPDRLGRSETALAAALTGHEHGFAPPVEPAVEPAAEPARFDLEHESDS